MKTIWLKHDCAKAAARLKGKFPDPSHAGRIIDADTRLISPDGETVAVLLCGAIPPELHLRAFELLKDVNNFPSNRVTAMGTRTLARSIGLDGTPSPRSGVNVRVLRASPARQAVLGWDRPGHEASLTPRHREMLNGNRVLIELADELYKQHLPIPYAKQRAEIEGKAAPYRLWKTSFTGLYVAKNFRTAYHRDGNLKGAMTAITPLGSFTGGALVLLRWRVAVPYQRGDLLLFDAEELRGNLPFEGERLSAAFFCGGWVAHCGR